MRSLDLALIGNGRIGLLVDGEGTIVWGCFPRFDGDPHFARCSTTRLPKPRADIFRSSKSGAPGQSRNT
jgi:hypothetical protein